MNEAYEKAKAAFDKATEDKGDFEAVLEELEMDYARTEAESEEAETARA